MVAIKILFLAVLTLTLFQSQCYATEPHGMHTTAEEDDATAALDALLAKMKDTQNTIVSIQQNIAKVKTYPETVIQAEKDRQCMLVQMDRGLKLCGLLQAFPPIKVYVRTATRILHQGVERFESVTSPLKTAAQKSDNIRNKVIKVENKVAKLKSTIDKYVTWCDKTAAKLKKAISQIKQIGGANNTVIESIRPSLKKIAVAQQNIAPKYDSANAVLSVVGKTFSQSLGYVDTAMTPVNKGAAFFKAGCDGPAKLAALLDKLQPVVDVQNRQVCMTVPSMCGTFKPCTTSMCYSIAQIFELSDQLLDVFMNNALAIVEPLLPTQMIPELLPDSLSDFMDEFNSALELQGLLEDFPPMAETEILWDTEAVDLNAQFQKLLSGLLSFAIADKIYGCMDRTAVNYNSEANQNTPDACVYVCSSPCDTTACSTTAPDLSSAAAAFSTKCYQRSLNQTCNLAERDQYAKDCSAMCCLDIRRKYLRNARGTACMDVGNLNSTFTASLDCNTNAAAGWCTNNKPYMQFYCPYTCGFNNTECLSSLQPETVAEVSGRAALKAKGCVELDPLQCAYDRFVRTADSKIDPCTYPRKDFALRCPITCQLTDCNLDFGTCTTDYSTKNALVYTFTANLNRSIGIFRDRRFDCPATYVAAGKLYGDFLGGAMGSTCFSNTTLKKYFNFYDLCVRCGSSNIPFLTTLGDALQDAMVCKNNGALTCAKSVGEVIRDTCEAFVTTPAANKTLRDRLDQLAVGIEASRYTCPSLVAAMEQMDWDGVDQCPDQATVTNFAVSASACNCTAFSYAVDTIDTWYKLKNIPCDVYAMANKACGATVPTLPVPSFPKKVNAEMVLQRSQPLNADEREDMATALQSAIGVHKTKLVSVSAGTALASKRYSTLQQSQIKVSIAITPILRDNYTTDNLLADFKTVSSNSASLRTIAAATQSTALSVASGVEGTALSPAVSLPSLVATPKPTFGDAPTTTSAPGSNTPISTPPPGPTPNVTSSVTSSGIIKSQASMFLLIILVTWILL
eukprot:PhF_6_TR41337/c1_g1_i1/m.62708